MLMVPVNHNGRFSLLNLKYRNSTIIREKVRFDDALPSEIIVNGEKFHDSSYNDSDSTTRAVDFINSKTILYNDRPILVTTAERNEKNPTYDVYEVQPLPKKYTRNLETLFNSVITDYQNTIPNERPRGRYISFEDLKISDDLDDRNIATLKRIVSENRDPETWPKLFEEAGLSKLQDTIDFLNLFECSIIPGSTIPESSLQDAINGLGVVNTRDYRNLKRLYKMAESNKNVLLKASYINQLLYGKPLKITTSKKPSRFQYLKKEVHSNAA